jgi:CheY-like chemotaxis protein
MKRHAQSPGTGGKMGTSTQKKILVVDEDLLSIAHISQTLLRGGYVLSHATDQQTALKAIKDGKPDLVICNLDGQKLDSRQLMNTVQRIRAFRTIPFLFVVDSRRDPAQTPDILGPKQYLKRPFTREQLASAVQERLGPKKQRPIS